MAKIRGRKTIIYAGRNAFYVCHHEDYSDTQRFDDAPQAQAFCEERGLPFVFTPFTGYDVGMVGAVLGEGGCCAKQAAHFTAQRDGTWHCQNCGVVTLADGKTVTRGGSVRCPYWCGHHLGNACPLCGQNG